MFGFLKPRIDGNRVVSAISGSTLIFHSSAVDSLQKLPFKSEESKKLILSPRFQQELLIVVLFFATEPFACGPIKSEVGQELAIKIVVSALAAFAKDKPQVFQDIQELLGKSRAESEFVVSRLIEYHSEAVGADSPNKLLQLIRDKFFEVSGIVNPEVKIPLLLHFSTWNEHLMQPSYQLAKRIERSRLVW